MQPIKKLPYNPSLAGMAEISGDIVYAAPSGKPVTLRVITPWNRSKTYPLVVFIQGSGWTYPNIGYNLPHLCDIARQGFVVATVTHRSSNDGFPFPAFLQDVKSAIRYLRAHAAEHCIDPDRVAAYGTSSGGNTSLLLGLTGDDPRYRSEFWPDESDTVRCVVDCFGPTDMLQLFITRHTELGNAAESPEAAAYLTRLLGHDWRTPEGQQAAHDMSPLCIVPEGRALPPMLLLYGDADHVVPYEQGADMYAKLCEKGHDARMICVEGAEHEGNFWSAQVHGEIIAFLKEHLMA